MKLQVHKNAVIAEIDSLFSEPVTIEMGTYKGAITYKKIDHRNRIVLNRLAQEKLNEFLKAHRDNTPAMFIQTQTEKFRNYQGYFPKYKSVSNGKEAQTDKEYYFALDRYLTEIERLGENTFEKLFKEASFYVDGLVTPNTGQKYYETVRQLDLETHKVKFSIYLTNKYNIDRDEIYRGHYFTKEHFLEYLKAEAESSSKAKNEFEQEKQTWQITAPKESDTNPGPVAKFYTDIDFLALVEELGKLTVNRVNDILEHHYTQTYFANRTSRLNWLNQLRVTLIKPYPVKEDTPVNISLAHHWVMNKIEKHVFDLNASANNWQTPEEVKKVNQDNRHELLDKCAIVKYFEEENIKVQLFNTGNEHFKAQAKLDHVEILEAENNKTNLEIKEALRTRRLLHIEIIREADEKELEVLFGEKFKAGKLYDGFKTEAKFAKHEIKKFEWQYTKYFEWFPILEQWFELLRNKAGQTTPAQNAKPTPLPIQIPIKKARTNPQKFKDIFANDGWKKYVVALQKTDPPLLNVSYEFIGMPKKHKGVICSWFKTLQTDGIIKQTVNRSQLASLLNSEFKNLNLGVDGKIFDMVSKEFRDNFEKQLKNITK